MDTAIFQGNLVRSDGLSTPPLPSPRRISYTCRRLDGWRHWRPHTSQREHLASYLFFLVEKGEGTVHFGGRQFQLTAGDCAFLDCSTPYSHRSSEKPVGAALGHFYGAGMPGIYEKYIQRGGAVCFPTRYGQQYRAFSRKFMRLPPPSCTSGI